MQELTGTVEATELRLEGENDTYMGWNFLLLPDDNKPVSVHVGGWYHSQIRDRQNLRVWGIHRPGTQLEANKIEDSETHGVFSPKIHPPLFGERSSIEGSAQQVFPINLPKGQTTRAVKGYSFTVMPIDGNGTPTSVVMWGTKLEGQIVKGNKVRVHGRRDDGNVLHTDTVEDLVVNVTITIRPMGPPWHFLIRSLVAFALVVAPWIFLLNAGATFYPWLPLDPNNFLQYIFLVWNVLWGSTALWAGLLFISRWNARR